MLILNSLSTSKQHESIQQTGGEGIEEVANKRQQLQPTQLAETSVHAHRDYIIVETHMINSIVALPTKKKFVSQLLSVALHCSNYMRHITENHCI